MGLEAGLGQALRTDYFLLREEFTPAQLGYLDRARAFVHDDVLPVINGYWERAEFPWPLIKKLGEAGLVGDGIAGYGCPEMDPLAAGLVTMELNRGDGSIGTFLGVQAGLAMRSIAMLGSEDQKQRWLPAMARLDALGAFALTEPEHGSDSVALQTSARPDGDCYILDGTKKWIGNATIADVVVVWARDVADGQVKGFLVEKGTPGYRARLIEGKGSLRAVWQAEIELAGVRVPARNQLPGARSFRDTAAMLAKVTAMQLYCRRLADLALAGRVEPTLASSPRVPTMVPPDAYAVGKDLAISPGAVVLRTPVFELIQYQPVTETVRELPLLIVPPTINKYYILDLAPGRSLIEYLVSQGQQVFALSWRNPDERHAAWGFDAYARAIIDALDAVADISGTDAVHLTAACSGGILAAMTAAAPDGQARVASLGLLVTMLDQSRAGTTGALVDETMAEAAIAASARKGYLDGRTLAEVFAWLRPGDLIWNYWVNNYLQGRPPPAFDILYWNADTTRMTAALHRDFVRAAMANSLASPGGVTVLGAEVDLAQLDVDCYAVAGVADHICPWQACYRSSQLVGGKTRFVLSTSGHIAALVNPAGNQKASYQVSDDNTADPADWQRTAPIQRGSWWPDYAGWLAARSGADVPAPGAPGNERFRVLEAAPGSYALAS
jgi:poly(3-hydroxyalkanoate) synthetase